MDTKLIASRSFINCHAIGMDSVLFDDTPGARLRCFVANNNHELWRNSVPLEDRMSVALHTHHCDVTLVPIYGRIFNVVLRPNGGHRQTMDSFRYESPITGSGGKFIPDERKVVMRLGMDLLDQPLRMKAIQLHSIYVPRGEVAAWWVVEGREDTHYEPICYSNMDLERFDFSRLYQPMTTEYLEDVLPALTRFADFPIIEELKKLSTR